MARPNSTFRAARRNDWRRRKLLWRSGTIVMRRQLTWRGQQVLAIAHASLYTNLRQVVL